MDSFEFQLPTKVTFGAGVLAVVGAVARRCGRQALLLTGRSSAKRSGVLDRTVAALEAAGLAVRDGRIVGGC